MTAGIRTCRLLAALIAMCLLAGCKRSEPTTTQPPATRESAPANVTSQPASAPASRPTSLPLPRVGLNGIRAVWVTRLAYRTADDVVRIMSDCQAAGFNHIIFQVRGNGTVFYPSTIEPWAEQFGFQSPGYDPLAIACREARARGMALHAWVNVMPAWRGRQPPPIAQQLYNRCPEWFWYDQHGHRQKLNDFYVSLNPCLPEVRAYLVELFREIVIHYDIDALHLDYVRFPSEPPAIPAGKHLDYPRDNATLALYKQAAGKNPDDDPAAWDQWRTDQVTRLVAEVRAMLLQTRPSVLLAAAAGTDRKSSLKYFRDDLAWAQAGLIDMAFPMDYKPDVPQFIAGLQPWLPLRDRVTIVPGLWTAGGSQVVRDQILAALKTTGNFCFFSYASLYDTPEDSSPSTAAARIRLRQDVLPLLQTLPAE